MPIAVESSGRPRTHLRASDIRGVAQLAAQATAGVAAITEAVHLSVMRTLGVPDGETSGQATGITGLVYRSVHGVTRMVSLGLERVLAGLESALASAGEAAPGTPQRETVLAALNGVMGDHLVASASPFATPMTMRYRGNALNLQALVPIPEATGHVLLLVHGLCMNDLHWHTQRTRQVVDHGETLAAALGGTPVYLRYNSGLHTSQNGHELSAQLEALCEHWPRPIDRLTVVAHSMGGLLIRGAYHYATQEGRRWPGRLKHIVFLGTPHHGSQTATVSKSSSAARRTPHRSPRLATCAAPASPTCGTATCWTRIGTAATAFGARQIPARSCPCPRVWPATPWPPHGRRSAARSPIG